MKTILLTQGKETIVDDDWYDCLIKQYKWCAKRVANNWYAFTSTFGNEYMHQIIMEGEPHEVGMEIDHINRNTLDNRRENLRWVTHGQNMINTPLYKNNCSGERGIYYMPYKCARRPWYAEVRRDKKMVFSRNYSTKEAAVLARETFTKQYDIPPL